MRQARSARRRHFHARFQPYVVVFHSRVTLEELRVVIGTMQRANIATGEIGRLNGIPIVLTP